jgi:hypothetical protein
MKKATIRTIKDVENIKLMMRLNIDLKLRLAGSKESVSGLYLNLNFALAKIS